MARILGIDYGDARIGFALSDPLKIIASPLEVLKSVGADEDFLYIKSLIEQNDVELVVIGLPRNMDGSLGIRAEKTKEFAQKLKEFVVVPLVFCDERLSSKRAEEIMKQNKIKIKDRKKQVDKLAAAVILQAHLQNPHRSVEDF